jgi:hypothetical protein
VPALISALKNEHTKRILRATRIRPPAMRHGTTAHYRMPVLEAAGGYAPPAGCPSWAGPAGLTLITSGRRERPARSDQGAAQPGEVGDERCGQRAAVGPC